MPTVEPAAIVTEAGKISKGAVPDILTAALPEGAGVFNTTEQVEDESEPPVRIEGEQVSDEMIGWLLPPPLLLWDMARLPPVPPILRELPPAEAAAALDMPIETTDAGMPDARVKVIEETMPSGIVFTFSPASTQV